MILINLISYALQIYSLIVLARVLMSWVPDIDLNHPIPRFLHDATEPVLQPIRQFLREQFPQTGQFDFSPIVLLVGITILQQLLISIF